MTNQDLAQAIDSVNSHLTACASVNARYKPFLQHLQALLAEQQRRAETQIKLDADVAAARAQIAAALPAMREYARLNPAHHNYGETPNDPNGVHAWLAINETPNFGTNRLPQAVRLSDLLGG